MGQPRVSLFQSGMGSDQGSLPNGALSEVGPLSIAPLGVVQLMQCAV